MSTQPKNRHTKQNKLSKTSSHATDIPPQDGTVTDSLIDTYFQGPKPINEVQLLINVLPKRLQKAMELEDLDDLIEVVMDLGRTAEARFSGQHWVVLGEEHVTLDEIRHVTSRLGTFSSDNRAGIPRTLHRISAIKNRQGDTIGLTCRVGKTVSGTIEPIRDIVESGKSILLLGRPGVGKTTKLREMAKILASDAGKRVVIVDTSNEIAGDGDIPHPAVGRARRMQVSHHNEQQNVMIEAVQNHTPEVIIVDEIGSEQEALAARTIAERGVNLVATAHGNTLENIIKNPVLSDLIGGIETVTLGDDEAKRRASQKTILERAKAPTFDVCIELRDRDTLAVYPNVAEAVDHLLRGWTLFPEVRKINPKTGETKVLTTDFAVLPEPSVESNPSERFMESNRDLKPVPPDQKEFRVFLYGISKTIIDRILDRLNLHHVRVCKSIHDADAILMLKGSSRPGSKVLKVGEDYEIPTFYSKTNTMPQIQRTLREALDADSDEFSGKVAKEASHNETDSALKEAQEAVDEVLATGVAIELSPCRSYLRRLQHELVETHQLSSVSVGDEPNRRLKVIPPKGKPKEAS